MSREPVICREIWSYVRCDVNKIIGALIRSTVHNIAPNVKKKLELYVYLHFPILNSCGGAELFKHRTTSQFMANYIRNEINVSW
jgi:hypothetical protein